MIGNSKKISTNLSEVKSLVIAASDPVNHSLLGFAFSLMVIGKHHKILVGLWTMRIFKACAMRETVLEVYVEA